MSITTKALLVMLLTAAPLSAQRNQVTIDASIFRGTVGYARTFRPQLSAGLEIGFGFPQIDRTLSPDDEVGPDGHTGPDGWADFEEYLHIATFIRFAPAPSLEIDAGVRAAIADLWSCGVSDCWPAPFTGAYVQPMVGWQRVKFGPRLTVGWIDEGPPERREQGTNVVALSPLNVRFTIPW